MLAARSAAKSV